MLHQNSHHVGVAKERGERERCEFIVTNNVRVSAVREQQTDHARVTVLRRAHQCRHAMLVTRIDVRDARQQGLNFSKISGFCGTP
jgi:hypothetical protein